MTLHIGEPSDCGVWFPSSGENSVFRYFLPYMYVEGKKKKNQEQNSLANVSGFSLVI